MRLWRRWRRKCQNAQGISEAEQALAREKEARKAIEAKRREVNELSKSLAQHRTQNHFAEMIRRSLS